MAAIDIDQLFKNCTRCNEVKPANLAEFPPHKLGKYGLHPCCRACKKADDAKQRSRPDQRARQKAWRDANKDYVKRYNDTYRVDHPSTPYVSAWRANNLEHARAMDAAAMRRRRAEDPEFNIRCRLRGRLRHHIKGKKGKTTTELLGYSCSELRRHIERQFTRGMTWERFLAGEIEIDHIIPVTAFSIKSYDDPDIRVCYGLANLRPMWAKDNRRKGAKRLTLL